VGHGIGLTVQADARLTEQAPHELRRVFARVSDGRQARFKEALGFPQAPVNSENPIIPKKYRQSPAWQGFAGKRPNKHYAPAF